MYLNINCECSTYGTVHLGSQNRAKVGPKVGWLILIDLKAEIMRKGGLNNQGFNNVSLGGFIKPGLLQFRNVVTDL